MKNREKEFQRAKVISLSSKSTAKKKGDSHADLAWVNEVDLKTPWVIRLLAVVAILLLSMLIL